MDVHQIHAVYFSGTGTTEKVVLATAMELAARLGAPVKPFDYTTPGSRRAEKTFEAGDLVVLGTPVYAGRVPNVLLPYLTEKIRGSGAMAIPVVLYGNRNFDDALIELRDILEADGLRTVAAAGFVGEHSFSRVLGAGRPDAEDMAMVSDFAGRAAAKISALEALPEEAVAVRGETPLRPYYTPRDRAGERINILKVKPKTDEEKCSRCGLCATLCPMGSISSEDPAEVTGICIKCGACVKKCPTGAKYYDDGGYLYHQHELEEGYARRAKPEIFL